MKLHQILSHLKRNRCALKLRPEDLVKLYKDKDYTYDYLKGPEIEAFFKKYHPGFNHNVNIRFSSAQLSFLQNLGRESSYRELCDIPTWWNRLAGLRTRRDGYIRLDQYNPYYCAKGLLEQEKLVQQIGSIKAGIKNPLERKHDMLVVVGTATGYSDQLKTISEPHDTMAVNGAGIKVPCDFWYSIHGSYLTDWKKEVPETTKRVCEWWVPGVDSGYGVFNTELAELIKFHYSGNMAMLTGIMMGYPKVLMVGCPLNATKISDDFSDVERDTWASTLAPKLPQIQEHFRAGVALFPEIKDRVRSISGGFTQSELGGYWYEDDNSGESDVDRPFRGHVELTKP